MKGWRPRWEGTHSHFLNILLATQVITIHCVQGQDLQEAESFKDILEISDHIWSAHTRHKFGVQEAWYRVEQTLRPPGAMEIPAGHHSIVAWGPQ